MKVKKLGWTDLSLTTIGLGTWAIGGGGWKFAWGPQDDKQSVGAILRALEIGINWIDTAAVYGLGHSEKIVALALNKSGQKPVIATKCGRDWNHDGIILGNLKKKRIQHEIESSLQRLQIETIDLYQIHWPQPDKDIEQAWSVIADAVKSGKIRYAGVSNFDVEQIKRVHAIHPVASLQAPYSMLRRGIETELLAFCADNNIGVIAYSPMQKGLLTGKFSQERLVTLPEDDHRRNDPLFLEPKLSAILKLVGSLRTIAGKRNKNVAELAIAWCLRRPEVTSAIVGARRAAQIEETAGAGDWKLSEQECVEVESLLSELQIEK